MKIFRRVYQTEDGIGLTELTIAMAVLLIGIFAVSTMLLSGILHVRRAAQTTTAGVIAADAMEQMRAFEWRTLGLDESEVAAADSDYPSDSAYKSVSGFGDGERVARRTCDANPAPCTFLKPQVDRVAPDGRTYRVHTYISWRAIPGGRLVKDVTVAVRGTGPSTRVLARIQSSLDGSDPDAAPPVAPPDPSAPTIEPIGNRFTEVGKSVHFSIDADDLDGDQLTFSATGLPPGVTLNTQQGEVTGTPTTEGTYTVTVTVSDPKPGPPPEPGTPASTSFVWTILPAGSGSLNLAQGKPANKSSNGTPDGGAAAAVDGDTDGNAFNGSVAVTGVQYRPWWNVDLGSNSAIGSIVLHNRTDCCSQDLGNFYVLASPNPLGPDLQANLQRTDVRWYNYSGSGTLGTTFTINFNEDGRYVQVQRSVTGTLHLAEVEIFAAGT